MILYDNTNPNGVSVGPYSTMSKRDKANAGRQAKILRTEAKARNKIRSLRYEHRYSNLSPNVR